jgi:hypothetical protein
MRDFQKVMQAKPEKREDGRKDGRRDRCVVVTATNGFRLQVSEKAKRRWHEAAKRACR